MDRDLDSRDRDVGELASVPVTSGLQFLGAFVTSAILIVLFQVNQNSGCVNPGLNLFWDLGGQAISCGPTPWVLGIVGMGILGVLAYYLTKQGVAQAFFKLLVMEALLTYVSIMAVGWAVLALESITHTQEARFAALLEYVSIAVASQTFCYFGTCYMLQHARRSST